MKSITLVGLANNTSLAIEDSALATLRHLGGDAKATTGSKTSRATGGFDRDTLAALSSGTTSALRRSDRDTDIISELGSSRATGLLRRVASLSLRVVLHTGSTARVLLGSTLASVPAGARFTTGRLLGYTAGAIENKTRSALRIRVIDASTTIERLSRVTDRSLL